MPVAGRWWDLATLWPCGNSPGTAGAPRLARRSARLPVRIGPAQRLDTPAHRRLGMLWKARSFPEHAAFAPHRPALRCAFALGPSARHEPDRETSTAPSARPSRGAVPAPGARPRPATAPCQYPPMEEAVTARPGRHGFRSISQLVRPAIKGASSEAGRPPVVRQTRGRPAAVYIIAARRASASAGFSRGRPDRSAVRHPRPESRWIAADRP